MRAAPSNAAEWLNIRVESREDTQLAAHSHDTQQWRHFRCVSQSKPSGAETACINNSATAHVYRPEQTVFVEISLFFIICTCVVSHYCVHTYYSLNQRSLREVNYIFLSCLEKEMLYFLVFAHFNNINNNLKKNRTKYIQSWTQQTNFVVITTLITLGRLFKVDRIAFVFFTFLYNIQVLTSTINCLTEVFQCI